ncbi:sterol desaturase family protein [Roseicella aerolata]|uniref:Sterol desaturase family protein n=1 Tax=Roseicella aerolata TaxID=2883479 RepID=A0A9X1IHN0_9PROT|nr:sterol desaturase family protein [Roseicella aerolata]MCB4823833.1 sterol desaturase family protein [Roseicella aerolata]
MLPHEPVLRLGIFLGVLLALLALEQLIPWRRARPLGRRRWPANLGLAVLGALLVRAVMPAAAVGAALWAEARGWGLLPALGMPGWVAIPLSVILLDLLIYWQHRVTHAVPLLWRLHRVHHADPELDATSGLRFHPVEILLSMALKMVAVVALGAPAVAVLVFEVLLNATAMFNHAAISLPPGLERALRLVLVTPEMHRTHHSEARAETDSCYGFCLSWWDRLFGSYRAAPAAGEGVVIGVAGWRAPEQQRLDRLLLQPMRGGAGPAEAAVPPLVPPLAAGRPVLSAAPPQPGADRSMA